MQEKIQKDLVQDYNICPNILQVDADAGTDADAGGIAIAPLH